MTTVLDDFITDFRGDCSKSLEYPWEKLDGLCEGLLLSSNACHSPIDVLVNAGNPHNDFQSLNDDNANSIVNR